MKTIENNGKPITMRQIAKMCGVSVSTVSGVINNRPYIRNEIREAVLRVIKETNYNPVRWQQGVNAALRKSIGLVLPTNFSMDPFYGRAVAALKCALSEYGFNTLLYTRDEVIGITQEEVYPGKSNLNCDGLIFFATGSESDASLAIVRDWGIRTVAIKHAGASVKGVPHFTNPFEQAVETGLAHLLERGYRRLGYLLWYRDKAALVERTFVRFAGVHGLERNELWENGGIENTGMAGWVKLMKVSAEDRPDAVLACSDEAGACLVNLLKEGGLRVPGDIAVMGINNDAVSRWCIPALTTVHVPVEEMVGRACEMLSDAITHDRPLEDGTIEFDCRLVVRGSTDPELAKKRWRWKGWNVVEE